MILGSEPETQQIDMRTYLRVSIPFPATCLFRFEDTRDKTAPSHLRQVYPVDRELPLPVFYCGDLSTVWIYAEAPDSGPINVFKRIELR